MYRYVVRASGTEHVHLDILTEDYMLVDNISCESDEEAYFLESAFEDVEYEIEKDNRKMALYGSIFREAVENGLGGDKESAKILSKVIMNEIDRHWEGY